MSAALTVERASCAVELHGPGQVGRALLARLQQEKIPVAAVHSSRGPVQRRNVQADRRILVDATPPRYGADGEPHVRALANALRAGTHVVTCNKAPLATAWPRLLDAAEAGGATLAISATVGAGTPILATLRRLHEAHGVARIEASLSGTLAFVVAAAKAGASLQEATRKAQSAGFAEPDPRLDLDGTDALAKASIVQALLWGDAPAVWRGRRALFLEAQEVRSLANPAVVAHVAPGDAFLELQEWDPVAPGQAKVKAFLEDGNVVELAGPGAGAAATGGALLADVRAVATGQTRPGPWP